MSKRLTFCRDLIEPLGDEDYFIGMFLLYIYVQIYYWAIKDKLLNKKKSFTYEWNFKTETSLTFIAVAPALKYEKLFIYIK